MRRHVVRVGEHFLDEAADMGVVDHVEDARPFPPAPDQAGEAELGQMLGDRGRLGAHQVGQLVDRVLALQQGPDHPQARLVAQQLEHPDGGTELLPGRTLTYLRRHADTLPARRGPRGRVWPSPNGQTAKRRTAKRPDGRVAERPAQPLLEPVPWKIGAWVWGPYVDCGGADTLHGC